MKCKLSIQEKLKDLRIEKGLSLQELSEETGISRASLGNYETDDYKEISHKAIITLIGDDEVETVKGIYEYIMDGEEKHLSLRTFDDKIKRKIYEKQNHKCPYCDKSIGGHTYPQGVTEYDYKEMECDHIVPWSQGG